METSFVDAQATAEPEPPAIGEDDFTLTFTNNGETFSTLILKENQIVVPPEMDATAEWRFVGWSPQVKGRATENTTYTAQWLAMTATNFKTVWFNANPPSGCSATIKIGERTPEPASPNSLAIWVQTGQKPWIMPVPTCQGYSFDGWYTTADDSGSLVSGDSTISADATYYAHWTKITYFVEFKVNTKVKESVLYTKPTSPYLLPQTGAYVYSSNGRYYLEYVLMLTDVAGNYNLGGQRDCAVMWPDASSIKWVVEEVNGVETRRKPYPYEIGYKAMYVHLNAGQSAFDTDGRYAPCTVQVLPPDGKFSEDGDIFDRYYLVVEDITATPREFPTPIGDNVFVDKQATLKSIGLSPDAANQTSINQIKGKLGIEGQVIPQYLQNKIKELIEQRLNADADHFGLVLVQFQQFLQMIENELNYAFDDDDRHHIEELCRFRFNDKLTFSGLRQILPTSTGSADALNDQTYVICMQDFNNHLKGQFFEDFGGFYNPPAGFSLRDYQYILGKDSHGVLYNFGSICNLKDGEIEEIHSLLDTPYDVRDAIHTIFGNYDTLVRYINAIKMDFNHNISEMFVADGYCNLFTTQGYWFRFSASKDNSTNMIQRKVNSQVEYVFFPESKMLDFSIQGTDESSEGDAWQFKCANRDLSTTSTISDAQAIHCLDDDGSALWYLTSIDAYLRFPHATPIKDLAYVPFGDNAYVIFNGDNYLYRFDNLGELKDARKRVLLVKENASAKLETFWTVRTDIGPEDVINNVYADFSGRDTYGNNIWEIRVYGRLDGSDHVEIWSGSPSAAKFNQFNTIIFGDSLFDEQQLKFHNMSKNKEMYDILDVNEVDGCYYGLFRNEGTRDGESEEQTYTVFKTANKEFGGVIHRLPYRIVVPSLFRTIDDLYSIYVVVKDDEGNIGLQEISVPDEELYTHRYIDVQNVMANSDGIDITKDKPLQISQLMMDKFRPGKANTQFFTLSNYGLTKFLYRDNIKQLSIDKLQDYKTILAKMLSETILAKHITEFHENDGYFEKIRTKVNQIKEGFGVFDLIPVEFDQTQDIGVIPSSKVDDTDTFTDHRFDSVLVSTDIVQTDGMFATVDTNPGIVTCAVSNPATMYDDDQVFIKSQRNTLIEGTEFYDYIYDQNGNALMDLYQVPFIYQVNSNNTYDLYVNVPTTRTKYLNRMAGTLKPDLTSQVLPDDQKDRLNFGGESLPNNLDESTTRLRVYIDRKFISVGNVELVEISGNSIPLQIYRDMGANDGLYDSIALESRWDGEVNEINQPSKDINKVMLEFECYGTTSRVKLS